MKFLGGLFINQFDYTYLIFFLVHILICVLECSVLDNIWEISEELKRVVYRHFKENKLVWISFLIMLGVKAAKTYQVSVFNWHYLIRTLPDTYFLWFFSSYYFLHNYEIESMEFKLVLKKSYVCKNVTSCRIIYNNQLDQSI